MKNNEIDKALQHLSNNDKVLSTIIKKMPKCNLMAHRNYYKSLIISIIGQQLSVKAAASIREKFFNYFNNKLVPEELLKTDDEILRTLGLSYSKIKYIKDLSQKYLNKEISFRGITKKSDNEIISELTKVKGIGVWTVHMFLMFTLGRKDVLPVGDLGIKNAIKLNYKLKELPTEEKVKEVSLKKKWSPYNTIAAWYLWKSLDNKPD